MESSCVRAPVAESPYHSRCQNRLVTGRVGDSEVIAKNANADTPLALRVRSYNIFTTANVKIVSKHLCFSKLSINESRFVYLIFVSLIDDLI